ncbi:unnamed protein product [Pedinophyceae sp. YPF-701]|nr:unnamed protein product [Pedinophyceae sp. YPF-701]
MDQAASVDGVLRARFEDSTATCATIEECTGRTCGACTGAASNRWHSVSQRLLWHEAKRVHQRIETALSAAVEHARPADESTPGGASGPRHIDDITARPLVALEAGAASIGYVVAALACIQARCAFVPVDSSWTAARKRAAYATTSPTLRIQVIPGQQSPAPATSPRNAPRDADARDRVPSGATFVANEAFGASRFALRIEPTAADGNTATRSRAPSDLARTRRPVRDDGSGTLALVMTSGSSGEPRAVELTDANVLRHERWWRTLPFDRGTVGSHGRPEGEESRAGGISSEIAVFKGPIGFVDHLVECLLPLLSNTHILCVSDRAQRPPSAADLLRARSTHAFSRLVAVPTLWRQLAALSAGELRGTRAPLTAVSSGEVLDNRLLRALQRAMGVAAEARGPDGGLVTDRQHIVNSYGCTELAANCCFADVTDWPAEDATGAAPVLRLRGPVGGGRADTAVADGARVECGAQPAGVEAGTAVCVVRFAREDEARLANEGRVLVAGACAATRYSGLQATHASRVAVTDGSAAPEYDVELTEKVKEGYCCVTGPRVGRFESRENGLNEHRAFLTPDFADVVPDPARAGHAVVVQGRLGKQGVVNVRGVRVALRGVAADVERLPSWPSRSDGTPLRALVRAVHACDLQNGAAVVARARNAPSPDGVVVFAEGGEVEEPGSALNAFGEDDGEGARDVVGERGDVAIRRFPSGMCQQLSREMEKHSAVPKEGFPMAWCLIVGRTPVGATGKTDIWALPLPPLAWCGHVDHTAGPAPADDPPPPPDLTSASGKFQFALQRGRSDAAERLAVAAFAQVLPRGSAVVEPTTDFSAAGGDSQAAAVAGALLSIPALALAVCGTPRRLVAVGSRLAMRPARWTESAAWQEEHVRLEREGRRTAPTALASFEPGWRAGMAQCVDAAGLRFPREGREPGVAHARFAFGSHGGDLLMVEYDASSGTFRTALKIDDLFVAGARIVAPPRLLPATVHGQPGGQSDLNQETGNERTGVKRAKIHGGPPRPMAREEFVVVASHLGEIAVLDATTQNVVWRTECPDGLRSSSACNWISGLGVWVLHASGRKATVVNRNALGRVTRRDVELPGRLSAPLAFAAVSNTHSCVSAASEPAAGSGDAPTSAVAYCAFAGTATPRGVPLMIELDTFFAGHDEERERQRDFVHRALRDRGPGSESRRAINEQEVGQLDAVTLGSFKAGPAMTAPVLAPALLCPDARRDPRVAVFFDAAGHAVAMHVATWREAWRHDPASLDAGIGDVCDPGVMFAPTVASAGQSLPHVVCVGRAGGSLTCHCDATGRCLGSYHAGRGKITSEVCNVGGGGGSEKGPDVAFNTEAGDVVVARIREAGGGRAVEVLGLCCVRLPAPSFSAPCFVELAGLRVGGGSSGRATHAVVVGARDDGVHGAHIVVDARDDISREKKDEEKNRSVGT